jgi:hypothetical protein
LGNDGADTAGAEVTVHHLLRRPRADAKAVPLVVTEPDDPRTVTFVVRPPHAGMPSRASTRSALRVPTDGYAFSTVLTATVRVHRLVLPEGTAS